MSLRCLVLTCNVDMGGYVVPLEKERLESASHYPSDSAPEYTDEYGRKVHDYDGLPWYL